MAKTVKNIEEVVQGTIQELNANEEPKKGFSHSVDMNGGKVLVHTKGFTDGEIIPFSVNGKAYDVEIYDNLGVIATGFSFLQYPAILHL